MKRRVLPATGMILLMLGWASTVMAQVGITIDGNLSDWSGQASLIDPGGADDERSPTRADITEFRVAATSSGFYLLQAWDGTGYGGGQASTAGVTVRTTANINYRVYTTAGGNPITVPLSTLDLNRCTDSTCKTQVDVCLGTACTGAQAGSNTNWPDPFSGRALPDCAGTNCGNLDAAVELLVPWALVGGVPTDGSMTFFQFGSYPSGPAQAPKDNMDSLGITCLNTAGSFQCYRSTPTAITLSDVHLSAGGTNAIPVLVAVPLLFITAVVVYMVPKRTL